MEDTIAAIATGMTNAGIGIIRISGNEAVSLCDSIYRGKQSLLDVETHKVSYGHIVDCFNDDSVIDEVLVTVFRAPRSYTREDVVEISSHGGILVVRRILDIVLRCGARPAEAGEFTKRAFLNGRIDLSQAESVMDIISSENKRMLDSSVRQLNGKLSEIIRDLRDEIIHETAFIESALDDPEHYEISSYGDELSVKVDSWKSRVGELLKSNEEGKIVKNGIRTVIVGKPNAGKSSLLNALAKEERAIVTDIPGTTRDIIEERIIFGDYVLVMTDTAGIRDSEDVIEKIGVDKSIEAMKHSDLILYMVDVSDDFSDEDEKILSFVDFNKTILIFNKSDMVDDENIKYKSLLNNFPEELRTRSVLISVKKDEDFDELYSRIVELLHIGNVDVDTNVDILVTNERHADLLRDCDVSLSLVNKSISDGMTEDFYMVDLMAAYKSLGLIIGEETEDDLIEKIFSEFCMGK